MKKIVFFSLFSLTVLGTLTACDPAEKPHTHTYEESWTTSATEHWHKCTGCDEVSDKGTHHGGTATCTQKAVCEVCGIEYGELADHEWSSWKPVDGTDTHTRSCSDCEKTETGNHTWNDGTITLQPTHTTTGVRTFECTLCHASKTEILDKITDHSYTEEVEDPRYLYQEGDCTHGAVYYKSCVCGESSNNPELVFTSTNFGHDYTEKISEELNAEDKPINLVSEATCENPATYYKMCSKCGEMSQETFTSGERLGHNYVKIAAEPTSYASGCIEHYECDRCGKYFSLSEEEYKEVEASEVTSLQKDNPDFACSESNPYLISNVKDLLAMRDAANSEDAEGGLVLETKFFKLTQDIVFDLEDGTTHGVNFGAPIGNNDTHKFAGVFDGDGHKIVNLYVAKTGEKDAGDAKALFSRLNGTVKNLNFENVQIEATGQRGAALVARAENCTIKNVKVLSGSIKALKEAGGIAGAIINNVNINDCENNAAVTATADDTKNGIAGGIAGWTYTNSQLTVEGCTNTGAVSAYLKAGGILGTNGATAVLNNNENKGSVTGATHVGGIAGGNTSKLTVTASKNSGAVSVQSASCGGILGKNEGASATIANSTNSGEVTNASNNTVDYALTGGILGDAASGKGTLIEACENTGKVSAPAIKTNAYIGGIAGLLREGTANEDKTKLPSIVDCFNFGEVSSNRPFVGGIVGELRARTRVANSFTKSDALIVTGEEGALTAATVLKDSTSKRVGLIGGNINASAFMDDCCVCDGAKNTHSHDISTQAPTCTEDGYINKDVCKVCGKVFDEGFAEKLDHDWSNWTSISDTEHKRICNNDNSHTEVAEHNWDNGVETTPATTEANGVMTYTCQDCGATKTKIIPMIGHVCTTLTHHEANEATCLAAGNKEYWQCELCERIYADANAETEIVDGVIVKVLEHDFEFVDDDANLSFSSGLRAHYICKNEADSNLYVLENEEYIIKTAEDLTGQKSALEDYGTEEKPFLLGSAQDLEDFRNEFNSNGTKHTRNGSPTMANPVVKLSADITLTSTWDKGIGIESKFYFSGIFDGQGHTISNVTINGGYNSAFFAVATNCTIKNLKFSNINVTENSTTTNARAGLLIGRADKVTVDDVDVLSGSISCTGKAQNQVGFIAVLVTNHSTVSNCDVNATIEGGQYVGGILGCTTANGSVELINNTFEGSVTGTKYVGGIVGGAAAVSTSSGETSITGCKVKQTALINGVAASTYSEIYGDSERNFIAPIAGNIGDFTVITDSGRCDDDGQLLD